MPKKLDENKLIKEIYDLILLRGGGYVTIEQKFVYDQSVTEAIRRIAAVKCPEELLPLMDSDWNKFCDLTARLCEVRYYRAFVYDENHKFVGFLVLRGFEGEELKTKHLGGREWSKILRLIKKTGVGRDGEKIITTQK